MSEPTLTSNMYIGLFEEGNYGSSAELFQVSDLLREGDYALQCLDGRKGSCFQKFTYCPFTGEEIDWKQVKRHVKSKLDEYKQASPHSL